MLKRIKYYNNRREIYLAINAVITPDNATDKKVTWKTSGEAILTVDKDGKITAKKVGKADVIVTSSNVKTSCLIRISYFFFCTIFGCQFSGRISLIEIPRSYSSLDSYIIINIYDIIIVYNFTK